MKKPKKDPRWNRVRDLEEGEVWKEKPEFITLEEHNQRVRLAHWYMRKAGMETNKPVIEKEDMTFFDRLRWLFFGVMIASIYLIATNTFGR